MESASNKKEKDAKLKHIIERLNNIHQINGQEIYSIKDDQELSELIDDIASGLKGEVISTDELKEFNEDYFDDYKLYKNDSNDNCCPQYKPQTVNHSIQKNRTNS
ncbi:MAG: hypothetical protein LBB45_06130 [Methanobrevibacter sp.]|nr:hypothetical protein [Candidatus Methanovirga basalitermitum]